VTDNDLDSARISRFLPSIFIKKKEMKKTRQLSPTTGGSVARVRGNLRNIRVRSAMRLIAHYRATR